jgi:hypothetical protein
MTYDPYPGDGGAGGYRPYPGGAAEPPQERRPVPSSVKNAARLMYVGATVSLIALIINLATAGSLKTRIHNADSKLTPTQVTNLAHADLILGIVVGLIGIGLWVWIALKSQAGRNWARVTGTVFFGLYTLLLLIGVSRAGGGGAAVILDVIEWLAGLGAVILLWMKDSSRFFRPQNW